MVYPCQSTIHQASSLLSRRRLFFVRSNHTSPQLSYPHFGPKNTRSNFFLFLVISNSLCLFYNFYCATNAHFTVIISSLITFKAIQSVFLHYKPFEKVSKTIACFPAFYSNFCIKSYKRVFWSFPAVEPIFSPYNLSLSPFNLSA